MSVFSAQTVTVEFTTRRFDTGQRVNADSLPTGTLVVNGADNAAAVTVTNVATGRYSAAVTLPTLAVNDIVELVIAATVNGVVDAAVIFRDSADLAAVKAKTDLIGTGSAIVVVPVGDGGVFQFRQKCDYFAADGRSALWTVPGTFSLAGYQSASLKFEGATGAYTFAATITDVTARTLQLEMSSAQLDTIPPGFYTGFALIKLSDGHTVDPLLTTGNILPA